MPLVPIILSGGAGVRLWPLSCEAAPKPFLPLPAAVAAGGGTLLAQTFARAAGLPDVAGLVTITHRDYYFQTRDAYAAARVQRTPRIAYLLEPFARNTAPAVALGALYAEAVFGRDATLLVLPADHLLRDTAAFAAAVARATTLARAGWLTTFGIAPTAAETGYGYLELGEALAEPDTYRVRRFIEKPPLADAMRYAGDDRHLWNSGMLCCTAAGALAAFARYAPRVLDAARAAWQPLIAHQDDAVLEIDPARFAVAPEVSFDVAVMEQAAQVAVVRGEFGWSDVGSWHTLANLTEPDATGNRGEGEFVTVATSNTYVHAADRIVAAVGVDGLFIVDTPDAVLVAHRDHLQRLHEVVAELKARARGAHRWHGTVLEPWGACTVLQKGPGLKIKRLELKPGAALSLSMRAQHGAHWIVVSGEARVTSGERGYAVRENEAAFIPFGSPHRLENPGTEPLLLIEVQCGNCLDDSVPMADRSDGDPG